MACYMNSCGRIIDASRIVRIKAIVCTRALSLPRTRTFRIHARNEEKKSAVDQEPIRDLKELERLRGNTNWSPGDLLPSREQLQQSTQITTKQLHHLLRLCALPPPASAEEEAKMLSDLRAQLHFVNQIQKVDTEGVEPLRSIHDETEAASKENEITLENMQEALAREEIVGQHHRRIKRRRNVVVDPRGSEEWNVLGQASKKVGKYFVVESGAGESP